MEEIHNRTRTAGVRIPRCTYTLDTQEAPSDHDDNDGGDDKPGPSFGSKDEPKPDSKDPNDTKDPKKGSDPKDPDSTNGEKKDTGNEE